MKKRRKVLIWGCLFMICLLTACHAGSGRDAGTISAEEVSAEMLETEPESVPETVTEPETTAAPETMTAPERTAAPETSETAPEDAAETGTAADVNQAGEGDQAAFTWLDRALAEVVEKEPGELTEEDYLSVTELSVIDRNSDTLTSQRTVRITRYDEIRDTKIAFPDFSDLSVPVCIDICDLLKCKNLVSLLISCDNTSFIHGDAAGGTAAADESGYPGGRSIRYKSGK